MVRRAAHSVRDHMLFLVARDNPFKISLLGAFQERAVACSAWLLAGWREAKDILPCDQSV